MLFDGRPDRPWGAEARVNDLVFIGRRLDRAALEKGFRSMPAMSIARENRFELRFLWRTQVGEYATAIAYSADGSLLAVGAASGEVHVFDARTGRVRWKALAHPAGVLALGFSPAACVLASAGQDGVARAQPRGRHQLAELPGKSRLGRAPRVVAGRGEARDGVGQDRAPLERGRVAARSRPSRTRAR